MKHYGKELIIDLHNCNPARFTRESLEEYLKRLCEIIDMERCDLHFWDYEGDPGGYEKAADHLKGVSAIQFITTSNITIHTLDVLKKVFINIFTCKDFDASDAMEFTADWFDGSIAKFAEVDRI